MPDTQELERERAQRVGGESVRASHPEQRQRSKTSFPDMQFGQKTAVIEEPPTPQPSSTLRCEVVTNFGRLEQLLPDWDRLWKSNSRAEIFQSAGWASAWWRSFGHHYTLCSIAVFSGNEVVGILPLVKQSSVIRFLGTPEADYGDIVCTESWASQVVAASMKALLESVAGWSECSLQHLSSASMLVRHGRELPRELQSRLHFVPAGEYQIIARQDENDPIFDSLLSKNHTKRRRNKLQKAGQLSFRHLETAADVETNLGQFCRHHARRFLATGRESLCSNPEFQIFLKELIHELGPAEKVRFGVLEFNQRPLAWHFGFQTKGKFMLYQHTFDLDAAEFTPGELMLWNVLSYAKAQSVSEFDFGSGDELYKQRFTNSSRQTYSLFVEAPSVAGKVHGVIRSLQGRFQPVLSSLKQATKKRATMRAVRAARMWAKGTIAGVRAARSNNGVWQFSLGRVTDLQRTFIWNRNSIDVFASDSLSCDLACDLAERESSGLEIRQKSFGDLVELAWQRPDVVCPSELGRLGRSLKAGDRVYVVSRDGNPVMVCCTSHYSASAFPNLANILGHGELVAIREYWSPSKAGLKLTSVLPFLVQQESAPSLWGFGRGIFRRQIKSSGTRPKFRITAYKTLGRFENQSVQVYPSADIPSSVPAA